jgi:putative protease
LLTGGVGWYRVELLDEDAEHVTATVSLYQRLLAGQINGASVWKTLQATNRLGVTRGTLESKRDPLAIL